MALDEVPRYVRGSFQGRPRLVLGLGSIWFDAFLINPILTNSNQTTGIDTCQKNREWVFFVCLVVFFQEDAEFLTGIGVIQPASYVGGNLHWCWVLCSTREPLDEAYPGWGQVTWFHVLLYLR